MKWGDGMRRIMIVGITLFAATPSIARTFGGYECTVDCSGHKAGYEWAEARGKMRRDIAALAEPKLFL